MSASEAMKLIRGRHNLRPECHGCVATIGNFDGLHLGHQAILSQVKAAAVDLDLPSLVMTFEPHPRDFFSKTPTALRLSGLRDKVLAIREAGIDRVLVLSFDRAFAALSADAFIQDILMDGIGVRRLVVGDDFRFGQGRAGDVQRLRDAGLDVMRLETFSLAGARVSSTRVRNALCQGDLHTAQHLLGRPYAVSGRVARGDQRGRTLGFPTANIHWPKVGGHCGCRLAFPLSGVFAVHVHGLAGGIHTGVANVGTRPTVDGSFRSLEVHIFDFDEEIYHRHLKIEFLHRLRAECRFDSLEMLRQQIGNDVVMARELLMRTEMAPHVSVALET